MANKYRLNLPGLENVTLTKNLIKDIMRAGAKFGISHVVKESPKKARPNIVKASPHIAKLTMRNYAGLNILSPVKEKKNPSRINMPTSEMEAQWDAEKKAIKLLMILQTSTKPTLKNKKYSAKPVKKSKNRKGRISNTVKNYINEAVLAGLEAGKTSMSVPQEMLEYTPGPIPAAITPNILDVAVMQNLPQPDFSPIDASYLRNPEPSWMAPTPEEVAYARGGYLYNPFYYIP